MTRKTDLQDAFLSGEGTDTTIVAADGKEFGVHGAVVDDRCPLMKTLATETSKGRFELTEPSQIVETLVAWLYGLKRQSTVKDNTALIQHAAKLRNAAEKYELEILSVRMTAIIRTVIADVTSVEHGLNIITSLRRDDSEGLAQEMVVERLLAINDTLHEDENGKIENVEEHATKNSASTARKAVPKAKTTASTAKKTASTAKKTAPTAKKTAPTNEQPNDAHTDGIADARAPLKTGGVKRTRPGQDDVKSQDKLALPDTTDRANSKKAKLDTSMYVPFEDEDEDSDVIVASKAGNDTKKGDEK